MNFTMYGWLTWLLIELCIPLVNMLIKTKYIHVYTVSLATMAVIDDVIHGAIQSLKQVIEADDNSKRL